MNALPRSAAAAIAVVALGLGLGGCAEQGPPTFQGWIEAYLIFVGPDETGRVEVLDVREGDTAKAGEPLFAVDTDLQRADLMMNEAALINAQQAYDRAQKLLKTASGTEKALEDAEAACAARRPASIPPRPGSPTAHGKSRHRYGTAGLFPAGRTCAGRPADRRPLPPGNLKVRFYVPETVLARLAYGEQVKVSCDGCAADLSARISFIAGSAEFTPPVIYSREERSKLVYLIEALPERPDAFRVGQPIDVALAEAATQDARPPDAPSSPTSPVPPPPSGQAAADRAQNNVAQPPVSRPPPPGAKP